MTCPACRSFSWSRSIRTTLVAAPRLISRTSQYGKNSALHFESLAEEPPGFGRRHIGLSRNRTRSSESGALQKAQGLERAIAQGLSTACMPRSFCRKDEPTMFAYMMSTFIIFRGTWALVLALRRSRWYLPTDKHAMYLGYFLHTFFERSRLEVRIRLSLYPRFVFSTEQRSRPRLHYVGL